jgi:hypothetical protein
MLEGTIYITTALSIYTISITSIYKYISKKQNHDTI